jgi:hypothetical protein
MKTSNKLVISAGFLILASLFVYDLLIQSSYRSGAYKDPFRNYVTLPFKNFDAVDINSSTAANVKFVQGPFRVRIDSNTLEYVRVKQQNNRLQIDASFKDGYQYNPNPYTLVISCPKLTEVKANAMYMARKKQVVDTIIHESWNMRKVVIDGFKQDSLSITQDYGSTVVLSNNNIRSVKAIIGKSKGSGSKIIFLKGNHFQNAILEIGNKSQLIFNNGFIHNLNYHLADSATVILTGAALNILKKQ